MLLSWSSPSNRLLLNGLTHRRKYEAHMNKMIMHTSVATLLAVLVAAAATGPSSLSAPDGTPVRALIVDSEGRIGVGTELPDPNAQMEIAGPSGILTLRGLKGSAGYYASGISTWGPAGHAWALHQRNDTGGNNDDLKLLRYRDGRFQGVNLQIRNDNGRVMIGPDVQGVNPSSALHVAGNVFAEQLDLPNEASIKGQGRLHINSAEHLYLNSHVGAGAVLVGRGGLCIEEAGKLGIGTTTPDAPLTVVGDVHITSGGLRFPDGSLQTSASAGSVVPGIIAIGRDLPGFDFPLEYESIGLALATGNLRLQSPRAIAFHTGPAFTQSATLTETGALGIGTSAPRAKLDVVGDAVIQGNVALDGLDRSITYQGTGRIASGAQITIEATTELYLNPFSGGEVVVGSFNGPRTLRVEGTTKTTVLEITGGADVAERFSVSDAVEPQPGMVIAIDTRRPGQLRLATHAYDRTVAGIISGANGINPGLTLKQAGSAAHGNHPVALSGRVYCWCDAAYGEIEPGVLLTTSDTPGHAMAVADFTRAPGATIGKAMTPLTNGKGLVLVLISLQ